MSAKRSADPVIEQLLSLLEGGQAHAKFEDAVENFPEKLRGVVPQGLPYSAWQLVEHLRIAQKDILDFSDPPAGGYVHRKWPDAYWPELPEPPSAASWGQSVQAIAADRRSFETLLRRPEVDLGKPFAWGQGQTLLREALLIADHNAYHTGELVMLRRLLGCWKS